MGKRTFRPREAEDVGSIRTEQQLMQSPVAVYYRQSTTAQVGNISTAIQTIDMVEELERRGWDKDNIILIDNDEGVSGTKRIDEREGMSRLFELIADRKIGAVACQDEDRLFRDMTQIQVNIFIDTCRKANVKVITPFFTYDFAHPLQGEFHARQFRFKCEMAAEYLKSYVLGRLAPARQRLMREGKWAGAKMPVGYMVDMRKHLPDGGENPNWRKFVPFEPYAQIVREYFRIFVECGCAIRQAMYQIRREGLGFPDCKPPDGYKISYQLKNRGDGYFLNRGNFIYLLTNPVYLGHWCYRGAISRWDNHAPIVEVDVFMRTFNALSRYTLTGDENAGYKPAYQYVRPKLDVERTAERPLLTGLVQTFLNEAWHPAGCIYEKRNSCYLYVQHRTVLEGTVVEWARRANWVDEAVVSRFKQKLQATFDSNAWAQAVQDSQTLIERERKIKRLQLSSLTDEMQNLIGSLKTLTHPYLIQEVEQRYTQMEQEQKRLTTLIANLDHQKHQQISFDQAYLLFKRAIADWGLMTQDERRNVLDLFIERIETSNFSRSGDMQLRVIWKDGTSEDIQIWHKPHGTNWTKENVERLLSALDNGASQLEIAQIFSELKWQQIVNEIKKHRGLVRFTPSWLGKDETYGDYVANGSRKGKASGSYWRDEELAKLRELVEGQADQLQIMREFPYRRWIQLKCRIKEIFGRGTYVALSGISQRLTYIEYTQETRTANVDLSSGTVIGNS